MHFIADSACMTQLTIRRVEEIWVAKAKALAKERAVSMNTVLVEILEKELGDESERRKTNGLEVFAGSCPESFGEDWDDYLKELNQVNPEDWK